jgi:hypothetical protein
VLWLASLVFGTDALTVSPNKVLFNIQLWRLVTSCLCQGL